uniref:ZP domain-containing protein n=1 Tax=Rhabditophanes sp. KR3021 TaxID=114890 RepID=A0AC35TLZ8_9BILA
MSTWRYMFLLALFASLCFISVAQKVNEESPAEGFTEGSASYASNPDDEDSNVEASAIPPEETETRKPDVEKITNSNILIATAPTQAPPRPPIVIHDAGHGINVNNETNFDIINSSTLPPQEQGLFTTMNIVIFVALILLLLIVVCTCISCNRKKSKLTEIHF